MQSHADPAYMLRYADAYIYRNARIGIHIGTSMLNVEYEDQNADTCAEVAKCGPISGSRKCRSVMGRNAE